MRLEGKVAVVTGASRGIGKAIARGYAGEGANVVITGRNEPDLEAVADAIGAQGGRALAVVADARSREAARAVVNAALEAFGRLDILVNNAGLVVIKPSIEVTEEEFDLVLDTNLKGVFLMSQAAAKPMIEASSGVIINIGSIASFVGLPGRASYCASKGGVSMLTKSLAAEWAPLGIRVNCLAPGYVRTEGHERMVARGLLNRQALAEAAPARRVADVKEIVGPALFLASDEASFVHGETFLVDGGWVADVHMPVTDE